MSAQNPSGTSTTGTSPGSPPPSDQMAASAHKRRRMISTGLAIAIAVVLLAVGIGGGYGLAVSLQKKTSATLITETGSTLLYPLIEIWSPAYNSYNSGVTVSAVGSGSTAGQTAAETATYNIGASDVPIVPSLASSDNVLNIPVAISAQLIYYNLGLPSYDHLNLNGTMLADIYNQTITTWDNSFIADAQNTSIKTALGSLPSEYQKITLLKRSDGSGDTDMFTSLCYLSDKYFRFSANTTALTGLVTSGSSVVDPEDGNSGMATGIDGTPGGIAYIGISYEKDITNSSVGYAALGDNESLTATGGLDASNYFLPTATTIEDDANLGLERLNLASDLLAVSLILGGNVGTIVTTSVPEGEGGTNATSAYTTPYPLVNLEYTLIKNAPTGSTVSGQKLADTVSFLEWAIAQGNSETKYLSQVNFQPLPSAIAGDDMAVLGTVST
jgi:phosphate transport system substrate-binding protein